MAVKLNYRFDHIHINCTDPASTERWFVEGLGAEVSKRYDSLGVAATELEFAGLTILLRPARPGEKLEVVPSPRFGDDHFGVQVDDLDAAADELKARGIAFDMDPRDFGPGLRIAFVRGPDNVRVELVQRG